MRCDEIHRLTSHGDVNAILGELADGIGGALGENLVGLYLTGSLTYGDFARGSSDIDYLVILRQPMAPAARAELEALHDEIARRFPAWAERIEGSYITRDMLGNVEPPQASRPYINGGAFWDPDPRYGNEWLINLHAVRERGVALIGPEPEEVLPPVQIEDVREASRRDLLEEWVPKLQVPGFLESSHHQAYATLTICRIIHRAGNDAVVSKRGAARWVRVRHAEPWIVALIERAERWEHGRDLDDADQVRDFIAFARERLMG